MADETSYGADTGSPSDSGLSGGVSPDSGSAPPTSDFNAVPQDVQATFDQTFKELGADRPAPPVQAQPPVQPAPEVPQTPTPAPPVQPSFEERINALGGWNRIEPAVELFSRLYTPYVDENGNPILDPETNTRQVNTTPFLEYMRDQDPGTFGQMIRETLDLPIGQGQETIAHSVLREYFEITPETLAIAQQIQKGQVQAADYLPPVASNEELQNIPPQYRDAYNKLSQGERLSLQGMIDDTARDRILETYKRNAEQESVLRQVQEFQSQQEQLAYQERVQAIENQATEYATKSSDLVRTKIGEDIAKAYSPFGANNPDSQRVLDIIEQNVEVAMRRDPAIAMRIDKAEQLAREVIRHNASRDQLRAVQAQQELSGDLVWIHAIAMQKAKEHIEWWSGILNAPRQAVQAQQGAAMGRRELATSGRSASGGTNGLPQPGHTERWTRDSLLQIANSVGLDAN